MSARVSVITVTFNSEKTLEQTIKSVIEQGYDNLEYIIIDGGSKDGTLDIVNRYRNKINVVISEKDNGISDAFNKGIHRATGEVIGIINSDDLLVEGALSAVSEAYQDDIDVYRGNLLIWNDSNGEQYVCSPTMHFDIRRNLLSVCHPSTFISKKAYEKWGLYDVDMRYMMDADLLFRFYREGAKFKHVDQNLAVFRLGGVTSDDWKKKIPEYRKVLKVNGASNWVISRRIFIYNVRNIVKDTMFKLFGPERSRNLFYKN